ncbi:hypothetical protein, partial [Frankia sp. AvcI1]
TDAQVSVYGAIARKP